MHAGDVLVKALGRGCERCWIYTGGTTGQSMVACPVIGTYMWASILLNLYRIKCYGEECIEYGAVSSFFCLNCTLKRSAELM